MEALDQGDVTSILEELSLTTKIKIKLSRSLCYFKKLCGKSKQAKLRRMAAETYEERLDIRNFFSLSANLNLLISLLLSKE